MLLRKGASRLMAGAIAMAAAGVAAGCQNGTGALDGTARPPKEKITQSELLAFCPPVGLRQGTAFFTTYENPAAARPRRKAAPAAADAAVPEEADLTDKPAQRVVYQTSITDVTRSCTRANGILTMKIAVAGRVVPGPAAKAGTLQLPIRVAVTTGEQVLYSQLYRHSVPISSLTTATQFLFTATDVSFPDPNTRGVRGYAGFDEGTPQKVADTSSDLPPD